MFNVAVALQGFRATFAKPELAYDELQVSCDLLPVNSSDAHSGIHHQAVCDCPSVSANIGKAHS